MGGTDEPVWFYVDGKIQNVLLLLDISLCKKCDSFVVSDHAFSSKYIVDLTEYSRSYPADRECVIFYLAADGSLRSQNERFV